MDALLGAFGLAELVIAIVSSVTCCGALYDRNREKYSNRNQIFTFLWIKTYWLACYYKSILLIRYMMHNRYISIYMFIYMYHVVYVCIFGLFICFFNTTHLWLRSLSIMSTWWPYFKPVLVTYFFVSILSQMRDFEGLTRFIWMEKCMYFTFALQLIKHSIIDEWMHEITAMSGTDISIDIKSCCFYLAPNTGLLTNTCNCGLRMCRECRERFPATAG